MMQKFFKNPSRDKILLGLVAGILLFLLSFPLEKLSPGGENTGVKSGRESDITVDYRAQYKKNLEAELENLLETVRGAGKVKVLVILADSGEKIVEKDVQTESSSSGGAGNSSRRNGESTGNDGSNGNGANSGIGNIDGDREEVFSRQETSVLENGQTPWVSKELLPQVSGVAVAASGAKSAVVKAEICNALEALFGLPAHKIKVLEGDF
ncbi:MAG: hypothetical protein Q4F21_03640 [Lachnospiraceae bacterium]|nr:hypothetical protein [Lachnospiraceae bacterium]